MMLRLLVCLSTKSESNSACRAISTHGGTHRFGATKADWLRDLIMTLGSFAVSPMRALYRMGFRLNQEEKEAYIAAWRHVGCVMLHSLPI